VKVTIDLPSEIVQKLIQSHLEDGEPVADKVVVLVQEGLKLLDQIGRKRIVLSVRTAPNPLAKYYLDDMELLLDGTGEKS